MPICTTCTHQLPYLYTVYESAHNLRLEQCVGRTLQWIYRNSRTWTSQPNCLNFADPYVEHDSLILLLDLILLKRGVFRHILFNRGFDPRQASKSGNENVRKNAREETRVSKILSQREAVSERALSRSINSTDLWKDRWKMILRLGLLLIFIDACEQFFLNSFFNE